MQWTDTEIVVVGGGIMGIATAFYLRRFGHEVTLIERKGIGEEASGRNAGSLSMQNKPFPLIPLAKGGMEVWKELDTELGGLGLKQSGGFRVGETEEDLEKLRVALEVQNEHGLNVRHLSPGEIQDAAPYLSPSLAGANFCPTDGFVDALTATKQIADSSQKKGLKIFTHTEVTQIEAEDGEVRIWTSADGGFRCQRAVVATSAWTRKLVSSLGLDLPINLSIFQLIVTPRLSPFIHHMITHVKGHLTVKQLGVGSVLIGGGWRGNGNLERDLKLVNYNSILGNVYVAGESDSQVGEHGRHTDVVRLRRQNRGRTSPDRTPSGKGKRAAGGEQLRRLHCGAVHRKIIGAKDSHGAVGGFSGDLLPGTLPLTTIVCPRRRGG